MISPNTVPNHLNIFFLDKTEMMIMAGGSVGTSGSQTPTLALKNVYAYDGLTWTSIRDLPEAAIWAQCYKTLFVRN